MKASVQQYAKTLLEVTEDKTEKEIGDIIVRFIEALNKNGQLKESGKIIEKFSELYNVKHGIVEAGVTSSHKLLSDQIYQVQKFIQDKYKAKEVVIENIVDEKIKGGIVIKVGDEVLDGSVANQLKKLKKTLSN